MRIPRPRPVAPDLAHGVGLANHSESSRSARRGGSEKAKVGVDVPALMHDHRLPQDIERPDGIVPGHQCSGADTVSQGYSPGSGLAGRVGREGSVTGANAEAHEEAC